MANHPMSRMNIFNFTTYVMQLVENKNCVIITTAAIGMDSTMRGKITAIDTGGPWPCIRVDRFEDDIVKSSIIMLGHIATLSIDHAEQERQAALQKTQAE